MDNSRLRRLNFQELITVGVPDVDFYTYEEYRKNNHEHPQITGYCVSCEEKGFNTSNEGDDYRLTNISHGGQRQVFSVNSAQGFILKGFHGYYLRPHACRS